MQAQEAGVAVDESLDLLNEARSVGSRRKPTPLAQSEAAQCVLAASRAGG
jgi:hypothetical protein